MKLPLAILLAAGFQANAEEGYVNFVRQQQQDSNVVWDMPVASKGESPSALALENGGSLFQLWTIRQENSQDFLLDQKLVGAYLPKAEIEIMTIDPDGAVPRTRVDQPFVVDINISDLLNGPGFPKSATDVLLERHLANYDTDRSNLNPVDVTSGTPESAAYIGSNGSTKLRYSASALTANNPLKASGEEHFVIHALAAGEAEQTQIASAMVQVWPVASGAIKGITEGEKIRFTAPEVELSLDDLYPRSNTYLMIYKGTQINGVQGTIVSAYPVDRETTESTVIRVSDLDSKITDEGTHTLALFSDTVYGRELLCAPVTFTINRTLEVNAMQVNYLNEED